MRFVKFYHRYEVNGGQCLQDQEAIIATGSYVLLYYPQTGEFLQIDEKVKTYPGAVSIVLNEYVARLGFFRGIKLILKNFIGISQCKIRACKADLDVVEQAATFEDFFEKAECLDEDLRPPVIVGGTYDENN